MSRWKRGVLFILAEFPNLLWALGFAALLAMGYAQRVGQTVANAAFNSVSHIDTNAVCTPLNRTTVKCM